MSLVFVSLDLLFFNFEFFFLNLERFLKLFELELLLSDLMGDVLKKFEILAHFFVDFWILAFLGWFWRGGAKILDWAFWRDFEWGDTYVLNSWRPFLPTTRYYLHSLILKVFRSIFLMFFHQLGDRFYLCWTLVIWTKLKQGWVSSYLLLRFWQLQHRSYLSFCHTLILSLWSSQGSSILQDQMQSLIAYLPLLLVRDQSLGCILGCERIICKFGKLDLLRFWVFRILVNRTDSFVVDAAMMSWLWRSIG